MTYTSDKPTNDLHRTGCRRYRDISRARPTGTAEAATEFLHPTRYGGQISGACSTRWRSGTSSVLTVLNAAGRTAR
jgi:hypothetical protein